MRASIVFSTFLILILNACNKDKNNLITYIDLNPDLILLPADSVGNHPSGLCQEKIPFPTDSVVTVELDINQDGINDYIFTYSTSYDWVSASSPCANHNSTLQVSGIGADNKIMVANTDMNEISVLAGGDLISSNQLFSTNAIIYRDNAMGFLYFGDFLGEGYMGFKLSGGELGWIKLNFQRDLFKCSILEYGYNQNANSQIKAGEM